MPLLEDAPSGAAPADAGVIRPAAMVSCLSWSSLAFATLAYSQFAFAQPLPDAGNGEFRRRAILDRIVTIEVMALRKDNNLPEMAYGNGSIITPKGMVITSKHLINSFPLDSYGPSTYKAIRRTESSREEFELAPYDIQESSRFDAATLPIKSEGALTFPYICIPRDRLPLDVGSPFEMQSYVFYYQVDGHLVNEWQLSRRLAQPVLTGTDGFPPFGRYWSVSTEFADSESGAPVLSNGKLFGIVAGSLLYRGSNAAVPIPGHQYFVPIGLVFEELNLGFLTPDCGYESQGVSNLNGGPRVPESVRARDRRSTERLPRSQPIDPELLRRLEE